METMEFDTANSTFWAHNAYQSLSSIDTMDPASSMAPSGYSKTQTTLAPSAFTMTALANDSQDAVERYGQITPPEEHSPPVSALESLRVDSALALDGWASHHGMQPLGQFDVQSQPTPLFEQQQTQEQPQSPLARSPAAGRGTKRGRTAKASPANQKAPEQPATADTADEPNPPKRKRGRPKSIPQPADGLAADGYPFPVSSARQSHLEKNRVAAHKCRQRRKEYINGLETRARDNQNRNRELKETVAQLRDEVLDLKNILLQHAGCGCWAIDQYIQRCAGTLLGNSQQQRPSFASTVSKSDVYSPAMDSLSTSPRDLSNLQNPALEECFNAMDMLKDPDDEDDST